MAVSHRISLGPDFPPSLLAVLISPYFSPQILSAMQVKPNFLNIFLQHMYHAFRYKLNLKHNLFLGFVVNEWVNNLPHFHKDVWCVHNKQLPQSLWVVILPPKNYNHIRTYEFQLHTQTHTHIVQIL